MLYLAWDHDCIVLASSAMSWENKESRESDFKIIVEFSLLSYVLKLA